MSEFVVRLPKLTVGQRWSRSFPKLAFILLVFCIFLLSVSGRQASPDEEVFFRITKGFIASGTIEFHQMSTVPENHFIIKGVDGKTYSCFGPGLIPLHLVFVEMSRLISPQLLENIRRIQEQPYAEEPFTDITARWAFSLSGPVMCTLLVLFSLKLASALRLSPVEQLLVGIIVAFATPVWAYSKTTFRDIPLAAFLTGGLVHVILILGKHPYRNAFIAGLFLGFGTLAKEQAAINVVLSLIFLFTTSGFKVIPIFSLGFIISAWPVLAFKKIVLGSFFSPMSGSFNDLFTYPLHWGILGLLFSPGKGLFIYAPVLLFAIGGLRKVLQEQPQIGTFILINLLFMLLPPATFFHWQGGLCWGPRLIFPMIPWLTVFAVMKFGQLSNKFLKILFYFAILIGIIVNFSGLALDWHLFHALQEYRFQIIQDNPIHSFFEKIAYQPSESMIIAGFRVWGILPQRDPPPEMKDYELQLAWTAVHYSRENLFVNAIRLRSSKYLGFSMIVLAIAFIMTFRIIRFTINQWYV